MDQEPEHVAENRRFWDEGADDWVASGEREWDRVVPVWGMWQVPDGELSLLPSDMKGLDAIELGCGTEYVSGWMARRGARVVGIDNSERQLATARRLAAEHGVDVTLVHGNAETLPLPGRVLRLCRERVRRGTLVRSWCDPHRWVPEAARILRPGGHLAFLTQSTLSHVCTPLDGSPVGERLARPTFDLHRLDWRRAAHDPGGIEFNLSASRWFRVLKDAGFEILDFIEVRAPADATGRPFNVSAEWARAHPSEQIWKARKAG